MREHVQTKAVVTVAEMARMVALSRARFYQLVEAGVFPTPVYDTATRRPHYTEEMQLVCLEARRRNCGVNGSAVLFYAPGTRPINEVKPRSKVTATSNHADLINGLAALGLSTTKEQVDAAVKQLFPIGTAADDGDVLRAVFLHLKRQNTADNLCR